MNLMPYGAVMKLKKLGWQITRSEISGRDLFHVPGHSDWLVVDNGLTNGSRWVFIARSFGRDIEFGDKYQPLEIELHQNKVVIFSNPEKYPRAGNELRCEDLEHLKDLFAAYGVRINYVDKRPEFYEKQIANRKEAIRRMEEEILSWNDDIKELKRKLNECQD